MKRTQIGFTLIELMIVVAIIGILAAVAIPAYQDYVVKSKLTKVISTLDPVKTALAMYYQENGGFPNQVDSIFSNNLGQQPINGTVWNSLGFSIYPTLPTEVAALYYVPIGGAAGAASAPTFAITLQLYAIRTKTIDNQIVGISPTQDFTLSGVNTASTASGTFAITGGSAIQWFYNCWKNPNAGGNVDPILKKFFNNSGTPLNC